MPTLLASWPLDSAARRWLHHGGRGLTGSCRCRLGAGSRALGPHGSDLSTHDWIAARLGGFRGLALGGLLPFKPGWEVDGNCGGGDCG